MVDLLTPKQKVLVSREIRREFKRQGKKPIGQRSSRKQILAIGFSKAREIDTDIPESDTDNLGRLA